LEFDRWRFSAIDCDGASQESVLKHSAPGNSLPSNTAHFVVSAGRRLREPQAALNCHVLTLY
jgi:hypothetical protein